MRYAHLVYSCKFHNESYAPHEINLGDYIQTIAADAFLPRVDVEVDRDHLSIPLTGRTKLIANSWYCLHDDWHQFSPQLDPLLVSMHVSQKSLENPMQKVLSRIRDIAAVRPVGCRDYYTLEFFQKHKIPAYFSGCLTLTLQRERFTQRIARSGVVISDCPYVSQRHDLFPLNHWWNHKIRGKKIRSLVDSFLDRVNGSVVYLNHTASMDSSHQQRFEQAKALLETYANAELVITSRLHCALPCLAMGTPVIFIGPYDSCRFQGLGNLVNHIFVKKNEAIEEAHILTDNSNKVINPTEHLKLSNTLRQTCSNFIKEG